MTQTWHHARVSEPISTRHLDGLPNIAGLRKLTRSLAMLDAIVCPEWEFRYYSFNSKWSAGEEMASMRTGEGDHWFALFFAPGAALHGLAHESPMYRQNDPWPGIWESLPKQLVAFRNEPAFDTANSTFCIWRKNRDTHWHRGDIEYAKGDDPDGSERLLWILDGSPATYHMWAEHYYGREIDLDAVQRIYRHVPLDKALVATLNPDVTLRKLRADIEEIGYPESTPTKAVRIATRRKPRKARK